MLVTTVGQRQFAGELIEVRESGLVILVGGDVAPSASPVQGGGASSREHAQGSLEFVPYQELRRSKPVDQTRSSWVINGPQPPDPAVREHFRLLSRFPQGLTGELLQVLLTAYGQSELGRVASASEP
jgi:hypothetical protein